MPYVNKEKETNYVNMNYMISQFYNSRFNRDNYEGVAEGEDIDNSRRYRLYLKSDIKELIGRFCEFFQWILLDKRIGKLYITDDIALTRVDRPPKLKYATKFDECIKPGEVEEGKYYITKGRYSWVLEIKGKFLKDVMKAQNEDPYFLRVKEKLEPELEMKNKEVEEKNAKKKNSKN